MVDKVTDSKKEDKNFHVLYEPPKLFNLGGSVAHAQLLRCKAGGSPAGTVCEAGGAATASQCRSGGLAGAACKTGTSAAGGVCKQGATAAGGTCRASGVATSTCRKGGTPAY